jgi:O-antigen ligase
MIGLGLIVVAHRLKGVLIAAATVVAGAVAYLVVLPLLPNSSNVERTFGHVAQSSQSNDAHTVALHQALSLIGDHPITGAGFSQGLFAHNLELQVVSVGGVLAFIGLLVIWLPIGLTLAQRLIAGLTRESTFAFCTICGIVAYWVFAQFEPFIWDRHLWFYIVLTLFLQHPFNERITPPPMASSPEVVGVGQAMNPLRA